MNIDPCRETPERIVLDAGSVLQSDDSQKIISGVPAFNTTNEGNDNYHIVHDHEDQEPIVEDVSIPQEQMKELREQINGLLQLVIDHPISVSDVFSRFFDVKDKFIICSFKDILLSLDYERLSEHMREINYYRNVSYYANLGIDGKSYFTDIILNVLFGDASLYGDIVQGKRRK